MNHKVIGNVISGNKIGRGLGFPTANIIIPSGDNIRDGVWAGMVIVAQKSYPAMINIGNNPTVREGQERRLEAHLLGFNGELYGKQIEVELLEFIRGEIRFDSLEELKAQIEKDKVRIEIFFRNYKKRIK